jgi:hypothetical protein
MCTALQRLQVAAANFASLTELGQFAWGSATAKNGHRQRLDIALLLPEFGNGNRCNGMRDCLVIADPLLIAIANDVVIAIA